FFCLPSPPSLISTLSLHDALPICFVPGFRVLESGVVGVVPNVCGDGGECGAGVHAGCGVDRVVVVHVVPGVDGELVTERGGGVDRGCGLVDEVVGDHASPSRARASGIAIRSSMNRSTGSKGRANSRPRSCKAMCSSASSSKGKLLGRGTVWSSHTSQPVMRA